MHSHSSCLKISFFLCSNKVCEWIGRVEIEKVFGENNVIRDFQVFSLNSVLKNSMKVKKKILIFTKGIINLIQLRINLIEIVLSLSGP